MTKKTFSDFKALVERDEHREAIIAALEQTDVHGNPRFNTPREAASWIKQTFQVEQLGKFTLKAFVFTGAKDIVGPHVIKFCYGDEIYLKFAELILNNPHLAAQNPLFPRINYVKRFTANGEAGCGLVIMEKLNVANHDDKKKKEIEKLEKTTKWYKKNVFRLLYFDYYHHGVSEWGANSIKMLTFLNINPRHLLEFFAVMKSLGAKDLDIHVGLNVATRDNGQFVIFDPLHPNDVA